MTGKEQQQLSMYDNITTAADLVTEVAAHGLSTEQDDLNRAADIFGNTSIGELARLANDIGRNNDKGEPDPNGSWSSSRKATQGTFYMIAFSIWNWREATAFFNEHTNPATQEARRLAKENKELAASLDATTRDRDAIAAKLEATAERARDYAYKIDDLKAEIQQRETETNALKAKLYDLITATESPSLEAV